MPEPERILVLTADAGFGHRAAANAIAAALEDAYAGRCTVEVVNPLDDKRTPSFLRSSQTDYDKFVRQMPNFWKLNYKISTSSVPAAVLERALTVLLFSVIRSIIKRYRPAAILSTHPFYMAPMNAYITLRKLNIPYLTVVTDLTHVHRLWFNRGADYLLVPTQEAYEQSLHRRSLAGRLQVTGVPVNPAFVKETRSAEEIRSQFGWAPAIPTALVVGSKRVKNLIGVLNILNHSGLPLQLVIVAGGDDELYAQLQATQWHLPTHLYNYVTTLPQFMKASELIISKAGGLIVTEALACGKPLFLVDVTPGQEMGNASYVLENGAGELATNPVRALEVMCHWLEHDAQILRQRTAVAASLGRPRSAYTIADYAWQAAEQGRKVPESRLRAWAPRFKKLLHTFDISVSDES
jgi:1,2-diacylglycerol 3-beta-galactosyltransferase